MLEPQIYRANEALAKTMIPNWRIAQVHNLDHFERVGFPVRLGSIREIGQIIDTMQENRFEPFLRELGGVAGDEYARIVEACRSSVEFQLTYLPHRPPVLPISTLLSSFALYRKLQAASPKFRSVLEIGPGCGYLSFFLRNHPGLDNYSQIEACESFYILQNLVNLHCFGARFDERALPPQENSAVDFFTTPKSDLETGPRVRVERPPKCSHFPWWRIGEVLSRDLRFDLVTSNANLLEFNPTALDDYLTVLHRVLDPGGLMVMQCSGHVTPGVNDDRVLLTKMRTAGFVPLFYVVSGEPIGFPGGRARGLLSRLSDGALDAVSLVMTNALFVKTGHPLFERYYDERVADLRFVAPEDVVREVFFERPPKRKFPTMQQFLEDTEHALLG